jgi:hypothetical protein
MGSVLKFLSFLLEQVQDFLYSEGDSTFLFHFTQLTYFYTRLTTNQRALSVGFVICNNGFSFSLETGRKNGMGWMVATTKVFSLTFHIQIWAIVQVPVQLSMTHYYHPCVFSVK